LKPLTLALSRKGRGNNTQIAFENFSHQESGFSAVQQATKFEFIVNLKAAKQIGLTIPVNVLERANKVIQ
jgi:ABC-type uncharacterized transport system substrate-binding protein